MYENMKRDPRTFGSGDQGFGVSEEVRADVAGVACRVSDSLRVYWAHNLRKCVQTSLTEINERACFIRVYDIDI